MQNRLKNITDRATLLREEQAMSDARTFVANCVDDLYKRAENGECCAIIVIPYRYDIKKVMTVFEQNGLKVFYRGFGNVEISW